MKRLKLLIWLLAPLAMFVLALLFLQPPKKAPATTFQALAVIVLDPVSMEDIEQNETLFPTLLTLKNNGLSGPLLANGSTTMDDALLEISTGKNPAKLRAGCYDIDPKTYLPIRQSPADLKINDLDDILRSANITVGTMTVNSTGTAMDVTRSPGHNGQSVTMVRVINDTNSPEAYFQRIESVMETLIDEIDTWLIVSPMSTKTITSRFCINQWLQTNGYLVLTDQHSIDFTKTQTFYAGGNEPGLRINREITYETGMVPRVEFEEFRKIIADQLRQQTSLFSALYPGERLYPNRIEGHYPDIVWEISDPSVSIEAGLTPYSTKPCQETISTTSTTTSESVSDTLICPGGWLVCNGDVFDHELQDMSRLENLLAADIAPTVLYLLRLPIAKDMDGRVLRPLMTAEQHRRVPKTIDSYSTEDPLVEQNF